MIRLRLGRALLAAALLGVTATAGCDTHLVNTPPTSAAQPAPPPGVVEIFFTRSLSDVAETPGHVDAVMTHLVAPLATKGYEVMASASRTNGETGFEPLAHASFDTSAVDGDNSVTHERVVAQRLTTFRKQLTTNLARVHPSDRSDPFGSAAAAAQLLQQYPTTIPRHLVIVGDELATTPIGCVLTERDLSPPYIDPLLQVCSPQIPSLRGVQVYLVGAGYSTDSTIPATTAQGVERLMRRFYELAGARMCMYGPLLVADGGPCS